MKAYPTLTETIAAALELAEIITNIMRAIISGELTPAEGQALINQMMKG